VTPTRFLPLLLLLATSALAQQPAADALTYPTPGNGTYTATLGVDYALAHGQRLRADVYVPDEPGLHPAILYLHTGAWITGDRDPGASLRQARRGYVVVSIDYELAPLSTWPAQIEDAKAAVRWMRANASRFRIDPDRIGVFGASAGGHIASVLGTSGGVAALEGLSLGNPSYSSRVRVVVDFYGPTDLTKLEEQKLPCYPGLDANDPFLPPSLLLGCAIQQCADKAATANPMTYITPDDPPFLILHGALDCLVSFQQSTMLYDALRAKGVYASLHILPTAGHADEHFDELPNQQLVSDFFDRYLRGNEVPPQVVEPRRRAARK
jgi:acetyl esterase/lipase